MPQGSDYIVAIQNKDFRFWKVVNGNVTINAQPYFLDFAPAGWQDMQVKNERNKRYWAVDRSLTAPLSYVQDGSKILKYIFLNKGMEEPVYLAILEQQLVYNPKPYGILVFTSGQSPFTPNTTTTGTITGTPGTTVYVKLTFDNTSHYDDYIAGNFDAVNFNYIGYPDTFHILQLTIPIGGVINFSIDFSQTSSGATTASMELVNVNGTTEYGYGYWYKQRFRSEVDLSTYSHEGASVKATNLEDGLPKYLRANENTVEEFPMSVDDAINVKMDGIILHNKVESLIYDDITDDPNYNIGNHLPALLITLEDAPYVAGKKSVRRTKVSNSNSAIKATAGWFLQADVDSLVEFEYDFQVKPTFVPPPAINPAARWRIVVRRIDATGTSDLQVVLLNIPHDQIDGNVKHIVGTGSITARAGDELYFYTFLDVEGPTGDIQLITEYVDSDNSFFKYKYKYRAPTTYIKAFRPQYLLTQFINKVTEGNFTAAQSAFLEANKNVVFTCGNAVRNLSDAVFKWSFSDFFQFWDSFTSAGINEVGGTVDLAEKQALIDTASVIDLPEPSDLKVSVATDFLYNEVEEGYPDIKNDLGVLNGNEAFNTKYLYSLGVMKRPARMDKVSKIAADPYVIEQIRVATLAKDTTDYKADNDIFPLMISNTLIPASGDIPAHYELDRSLNASTTGLLEPDTVFNIGLSPHLNLKRNGPWYRSCLWLCDNKILAYKSSDKNNKLTFTDPVFGAIIEKADENIGGLGDQFFVPIVFDITVPPPNELISLLDSNPLQVYRFPFYGNYYTCILLSITTGMASHKEQQWKMLSLPTNDLKKLENYFG